MFVSITGPRAILNWDGFARKIIISRVLKVFGCATFATSE